MTTNSLETRVNIDIPDKSVWAVKHGNVTFYYKVTNGWQRRHASIEDSVRWQFPHVTDFTVRRVS